MPAKCPRDIYASLDHLPSSGPGTGRQVTNHPYMPDGERYRLRDDLARDVVGLDGLDHVRQHGLHCSEMAFTMSLQSVLRSEMMPIP